MSQEKLRDQHLNANEVADLDPYNQRGLGSPKIANLPKGKPTAEQKKIQLDLPGVRKVAQQKKDQDQRSVDAAKREEERKKQFEKQRLNDAKFLKTSTAGVLLKQAAEILGEAYKVVHLSITDPSRDKEHYGSLVKEEEKEQVNAILVWDEKVTGRKWTGDYDEELYSWKQISCTLKRDENGKRQFVFQGSKYSGKIDPIPSYAPEEKISKTVEKVISDPEYIKDEYPVRALYRNYVFAKWS